MFDYLVSFMIPKLESAGHICVKAKRPIEPNDLPLLCARLAIEIESERQKGEPIVMDADITIVNIIPLSPNSGTPQTFHFYPSEEDDGRKTESAA